MTAAVKTAGAGGSAMLNLPRLDYPLLVAALLLLGIGTVMVGSASMHRIDGAPFYFVYRHLFAILLGFVGSLVVLRIPMTVWERLSPMLYFFGLALLVLVLIPGVGREANGAQRWIPLGGFNLQSSEFMKLFMLLYLAGYLNRRQTEVATSAWGFIKPMLPLLIASALIMLQPDMGTTIVLLATAFGMLFLGGVPWRQFAVLIAIAAVSLGTLVWLTPWRMQRVTSFMDPFADPLDSGYQLSNALIALGRGEWFGVGLGESVQKLYYLPEAHNDFLLSVIGEELGFAGVTLIILLFTFIVWRAMRIGVLAEGGENRFAVYTAYGCALWLGFQSFVNIGVNLGMMPTKGLTLPFMSYGGNSIIVGMLVIAMLQRIHLEHAPEKRREGGAWRTSS
jgi:cell division protein FtsW